MLVPGKIEGSVVAYGETGNLITDITAAQLRNAPTDESVVIVCDEHETMGIFGADHNQPPMTYIALVGESGNLELAIVGDSAKIMLGVARGTPVSVKW
jgi:S-adenosylmethionine hydrolase